MNAFAGYFPKCPDCRHLLALHDVGGCHEKWWVKENGPAPKGKFPLGTCGSSQPLSLEYCACWRAA